MPFGRVLTAMITPMQEDGSVNFKEAARLARYLVEHGSDGVVVAGSTGESATLNFAEKVELFRVVREAIGPECRVLAGAGSNVTRESVELTKAAAEVGVDGIMLVVPYYNKPTQEGLYRHFRTIAESTQLPVMLYNVPGRTAQNLLPETVQRLVEDVPNIVALKEASGNLEQVSWIRRLTPDSFSIYSGDDALTLPMLAVGAVGVVSVASHVVGEKIQRLVQAFQEGRTEEAAALHSGLLPIFKAMFVTTNPIPVKVAMRLLGFEAGPLRLPLTEPTDEQVEQIRKALRAYAII